MPLIQGCPVDIRGPGARQQRGALLETQKLKLNIQCIALIDYLWTLKTDNTTIYRSRELYHDDNETIQLHKRLISGIVNGDISFSAQQMTLSKVVAS